jgi:hypothetical protein
MARATSAAGRVRDMSLGPRRSAALAVALYALLALPILAMHRFDLSAFVVAGDHFVEAGQTGSPSLVHRQSRGYDGQFYYRMALAPLSFADRVGGVRFDHPAKRMQRIIYPALAWALSGGEARFAPAALFGLNLLALGAIASLAVLLARAARLPGAVAAAIVLWPGFIISLTHDTTEILATAFVLAALLARVRARPLPYACLGALAVLTRETAVLVFAGIFLWDAAEAWKRRRISPDLYAGMAILLPPLVWNRILAASWAGMPQDSTVAQDLGFPFFGITDMLVDCVTGGRLWASTPAKDLVLRAIVLLTAPAILVFCVAVAMRIGRAWRSPGRLAALCLSWCLIAALMSLLSEQGPWIDPDAYLRAFTECFVIGCLVLGLAGPSGAPGLRSWVGGAGLFAICWVYCLVQLRIS